MKSIFLIIAAIIIAVLGMSFYMLNDQVVSVDFYFGKLEEPRLPLVILGAFAIGVFIGFIATLSIVFSHKREIRRLKKIQKSNEEELTNLRNMPLKDSDIGTDIIEVTD